MSNRIVFPAVHTSLGSTYGLVTDAMVQQYARRAQGGAGLVIVEVAAVQYPQGRQSLTELRIDDPICVPGLSRLARAITDKGAACFLQLFHAGAQTLPILNGGHNPVSPSGLPVRVLANSSRALSSDEIIDLRERFIQAGSWAAEAGFDGVELHAAHGYLLSEFLSPLTNQRQDDYGGSREGRCRLLQEVISGIKAENPQLIVSVRINGDDFLPDGITDKEAGQIAFLLQQAGADVINVSAGMYDSGITSIESNAYAPGWRLYLSQAVKQAVTIPVIGGGVIFDPQLAQNALENGWLDLVFVGRSNLADYDWGRKALRLDDKPIRPCIRCNTCVDTSFAGGPLRCAVNPEVGGPPDERDAAGSFYWLNNDSGVWPANPGASQQKVLVVGSGPAGMMAAEIMASQGHQVTIMEKQAAPGGLLELAALPPHKGRINLYRDYMLKQLLQAGVHIITECQVDNAVIRSLSPDLLIAALGSQAKPLGDVLSSEDPGCKVLTLEEAWTGDIDFNGKYCLILGGGQTGLETAQLLGRRGAVVNIVESASQLAGNMEKKNRRSLLNDLKELNVTTFTSSTVSDLFRGQAALTSPEGEHYFQVDYVVPAYGRDPVTIPADWLEMDIPILVLGDAAGVGTIASAVRSAYLALTVR